MLNITLGEAVAALGGQVIFLAAAGWLVKTLVSHRLTKQADEFKIQLKSSADLEIERLRASLQQVATEHEIRFAKLHEKCALVIAELYSKLVDAPAHAGQFISQNVRNPEEAAKATAAMWDLYRFINLNRIYLPETVCSLLDKFETRIRNSVMFVDIYWTRIPNPTADTMQDQSVIMRDACKALDSELPALLKEVEREFRMLLGGS